MEKKKKKKKIYTFMLDFRFLNLEINIFFFIWKLNYFWDSNISYQFNA